MFNENLPKYASEKLTKNTISNHRFPKLDKPQKITSKAFEESYHGKVFFLLPKIKILIER